MSLGYDVEHIDGGVLGDEPSVTTVHDDHHASGGHHISGEGLVVLFLFAGLLIGGLVREINKRTGIPYTPMLFMLGIFFGFYNHSLGMFGLSIQTISEIDPHGILLIFLPTMIFEAGFNADWHIFKKQFVQVFLLAVPCVMVSAVILMFCIKLILGYSDEYYTWSGAFLFGSILSCTDTVAVISLLKEVGAAKKFNALIEGESLINDGTCMVLLQISSELVKGRSKTIPEICSTFLSLTVGGTILGLIFGIVATIWIRKIYNDEVLVVNITFLSCYLLFFVAENVNLGAPISGIIALVSLGLFMAAFGKTRISVHSEHAVHTFWKYTVYCAETIIFLLAGIIIGTKVFLGETEADAIPLTYVDVIKLFGLYLCMNVARFLAIGCFMPIMKNSGYGLAWRDVFILTYGGLRGAIGVAFALLVARDTEYAATFRQLVLFDMSCCAIMTLILNGTTTGYFVRMVGLASTTNVKQRVFISFLQEFIHDIKENMQQLKSDPNLQSADWAGEVTEMIGIENYKELIQKYQTELNSRPQDKLDLALSQVQQFFKKESDGREETYELQNLRDDPSPSPRNRGFSTANGGFDDDDYAEEIVAIEIRNRFLMTLKGEYFHQFETNTCGPDAYILLLESANWDLDNDAQPMNSWDYISNHFLNQTYIKILFRAKSLPYIGQHAKNALFNHMSFVYDVVSSYIMAHEEVEKLFTEETMNLQEEILKTVIKESEENRNYAEAFLNGYLNVSFPEITEAIQNKKAAHSVLNWQNKIIEETFAQGQIDEKEYKTLKKTIDNSSFKLGESNESWEAPPLKKFLETIEFFRFFDNAELDYILEDAEERDFQKDDHVMRETQKTDYFFIITRGMATEYTKETSSTYKEKRSVGDVFPYYQLVSGAHRYLTSVMADSMVYVVRFNLNKIREKLKKDKKFEQYVWRRSFAFLIKHYSMELRQLANLDKTIVNMLAETFIFKKYRAGQTIEFVKGGIFLKGKAIEVSDKKSEDLSEETPKNSQIAAPVPSIKSEHHQKSVLPEMIGGNRVYRTLTMISTAAPGQNPMKMKCEKVCTVFHFDNIEALKESLLGGEASVMGRDRSSFRFSMAIQTPRPIIVKETEEESKGDQHH
jgi:NhaP-type Na+/H+ or K+/H+ antiporter